MKNIVHVVMSLTTGGIENMVVDIANIQSNTHNVTLIVFNNLIDDNIKNRLKPVVNLIEMNRKPKSHFLWHCIIFYTYIFNLKPDILHIHDRKPLKLFPKSVFKKRLNIIHTVHAVGYVYGNEIHNASHLCTISQSVQQDLLSRYQIKSKLVYNGVESNSIPCKTNYPRSGPLKIVQISRLQHEEKGQDILIDALSILRTQHPALHFHLDFIGDGESQPLLSELIHKKGLSQFVTFKGSLSRDNVYKSLPDWDLLIQPSRKEGFGLTVAEAMAASVPVIISDQEGPMEVIQKGRYGHYFESNNSQQLAQAIIDIKNKYQSGKISSSTKNAKNHVRCHFDIATTAHKYTSMD